MEGKVTIFCPIGTLMTSTGTDCFFATSGSTGNLTVTIDGTVRIPLGTSNAAFTVVVSVRSPNIIGLVGMECILYLSGELEYSTTESIDTIGWPP